MVSYKPQNTQVASLAKTSKKLSGAIMYNLHKNIKETQGYKIVIAIL